MLNPFLSRFFAKNKIICAITTNSFMNVLFLEYLLPITRQGLTIIR